MFQVVWSSVVHAFWCYPQSVVHIFPTLSWLVPWPSYHYRNCCSFYPPHSFTFDFKVFQLLYLKCSFQWGWTYQWAGSLFRVCSWLQCLVFGLSLNICLYWHLPQDCDVVLLLFRAHAQTISRLCLYSSLCRCSSGGMTMAALLVCVCIQYWPAHDHSAPCHNMVNSFLKLTTNPVH